MHGCTKRAQLTPGTGLLLAAVVIEAAGAAWTGSLVLAAAAAWHLMLVVTRPGRWGAAARVIATVLAIGAVAVTLTHELRGGPDLLIVGVTAAAFGICGYRRRRDLDGDFVLVELALLALPLAAGLVAWFAGPAWLDLLLGWLVVLRAGVSVAAARRR